MELQPDSIVLCRACNKHVCLSATVNIGEYTVCNDCIEAKGYVTCDHCGALKPLADIHDGITGDKVCNDCFDGIITCEWCNEDHYKDEMTLVHNNTWLCRGCAEDAYVCDDCGEVISINDVYSTDDGIHCMACYNDRYVMCYHCGDSLELNSADCIDIGRGQYVCNDCYCENYRRCESCGDILHNDDVYYDEDAECDCCESCYSNKEPKTINDYGYKPSPKFYGGESYNRGRNRQELFLGIEDECENEVRSIDNIDGAQSLLNTMNGKNEHVYCKHDGSLDNGFEIVSHPMTLAYHKSIPWESGLRELGRMGFRSHDTDTCGLHIHVNKNFFTVNQQIKLGIFIAENKGYMERLGRRAENSYAKFKDVKYRGKRFANTNDEGRYEALNWQNRNTIEFRLYKGTLNYKTFMATLELTDAICWFVKTVNTVQIVGNDAWLLFREYVSKNTKRYTGLIEYMEIKRAMIHKELAA